MSEFKLEFVGKEVKDMYGTFMGKVVGVITDIDGSIESVGVDCGLSGLNQLDAENKSIKSVLFDAKLQYRSSELTEETYQQISIHTNDLIEHVNLEKAEINNVKMRLTQQTLDSVDLAINTPHQKLPGSNYTESPSKIETSKQNEAAHIIVADEGKRTEEKAVQSNTNNNETDENSWLNHVIQNE